MLVLWKVINTVGDTGFFGGQEIRARTTGQMMGKAK